MPSRDRLHRLVDDLPESQLLRAKRVLEALKETSGPPGPLHTLETAPLDDEPETPEERAAVEEARGEIREGRTVAHEEVKRRWGLG